MTSVDADGSWDDTPAIQAVAAQPVAQVESPVAEVPDAPAAAADLDEAQPYGRLVGAAPAHYIQARSVFGIDKKYLGSAQEL